MLARKSGVIAVLCRSLHVSSRSCHASTAFVPAPLLPSSLISRKGCSTLQLFSDTSSFTERRRGLEATRGTRSWSLDAETRSLRSGAAVPRTRNMSTAAFGAGRQRAGRQRSGRSGGAGSRGPLPDYEPDRAGHYRANVPPGTAVEVVQKHHQQTGQLTSGTVSRLLTSSSFHPRGIKVMLLGGVVGRVQKVKGVDATTAAAPRSGKSSTTLGYVSSSSSSSTGARSDHDHAIPSTLVASTTIGAGRRRRRQADSDISPAGSPAASSVERSAAPAPNRPARKFRAERVQGRSWSLEGGELVARGANGEELSGASAAIDNDAGFGRRRGRGGSGKRGGKR